MVNRSALRSVLSFIALFISVPVFAQTTSLAQLGVPDLQVMPSSEVREVF